jgi:hypothetical protein
VGDGRRALNLLLLLGAIAAGILFGIWSFEAISG